MRNIAAMMTLSNVINSNLEYMLKPAVFEFSYENSLKLKSVDGVFENNVDDEVIMLKIVHNICMLYYFSCDFYNKNSSYGYGELRKGMYMKLQVKAGDVNILEQQGLAFLDLAYRADKVNSFLRDIKDSIFEFIEEKQTVEKYSYLSAVSKFKSRIRQNFDLDESTSEFISDNFSLYDKYLLMGPSEI